VSTPRKHYFRVGDSILREPWPREVKLTCVLLQAHLNTRWRRDGIPNEQAGQCYLSQGAIFDVTGRKRIRSGMALLSKLSESVSLAVELRGDYIFIDWPKFAEFQNFDSRSQAPAPARDEPPPAPAPAPAPYSVLQPPSELSSGAKNESKAKGNGKASKAVHPDASKLATELRQQLLAHVNHWTPPKTLNGWINDFDKMLRLDGNPPGSISSEVILKVIRWIARDPFEKKNVHSAAKLRQRFGSLHSKATTSPGQQALPGSQNIHKVDKLEGWKK
jgi:hypothetical protein